jgi:hypothetical protein
MEDKTIICSDCGEEFIFTAEEQEFYQEKGFANEPRRCKPCRQKRKSQRSGRSLTNRYIAGTAIKNADKLH